MYFKSLVTGTYTFPNGLINSGVPSLQFVRQCRQDSVVFLVDSENAPKTQVANAIRHYVDRFTVGGDGFGQPTNIALVTYSTASNARRSTSPNDRFTIEQVDRYERKFSPKLQLLADNKEVEEDDSSLERALERAFALFSSVRSTHQEVIVFPSTNAEVNTQSCLYHPIMMTKKNSGKRERILSCYRGLRGYWFIQPSTPSKQVCKNKFRTLYLPRAQYLE